MKKIFISLYVLSMALNALDNNNSLMQLNDVKGHLYLYNTSLIYAGSDIAYYKEAFDIDVMPSDILAPVKVASENVKEDDLTRREKEFKNQLSRTFKSFLPLKVFMGKEENDIVKLVFYGQVVHLKCMTSYMDKERYNFINPFSNTYSSLLLKFLENQNSQHRDKNLLVDGKVLVCFGTSSHAHGAMGYNAIIEHCPTQDLNTLGIKLGNMLKSHATNLKNTISCKTDLDRQSLRIDMIDQTIAIGNAMQMVIKRQESEIKKLQNAMTKLIENNHNL